MDYDPHDHTAPHHHDEFEDTHIASPDDDEWFVHTADEPHAQAAHGRINSTLIGGVLLLTIIGTGLVGWIFTGYVPRMINRMRVDRQENSLALVAELQRATTGPTGWNTQLTQKPAWEPRLTGEPGEGPRLRIPLEMAQDAVIERYRRSE